VNTPIEKRACVQNSSWVEFVCCEQNLKRRRRRRKKRTSDSVWMSRLMVVCASLTAGGKHRAFRRRQLLSVTIHCCCCCCRCRCRCRLNNATPLVSSTASLLLIRQPSDSKILTTLTPILVENFYASADNSYEPLEVLWFQLNSTQLTQDNSRRNEKLKNENYYFKNRIPLSSGPWVINPVTTFSLPIMHMTQQWASSYSEHNVTMTETLPKGCVPICESLHETMPHCTTQQV